MSTSILLNAQSDIKANTVTEDTPATEQTVETPQPTAVSEEAPSSKETKTPQTPSDAGETVADDANDLAPLKLLLKLLIHQQPQKRLLGI